MLTKPTLLLIPCHFYLIYNTLPQQHNTSTVVNNSNKKKQVFSIIIATRPNNKQSHFPATLIKFAGQSYFDF